MPQPYFVKGLIGKVLAYGGLQIRKYIPHGLQIPADKNHYDIHYDDDEGVFTQRTFWHVCCFQLLFGLNTTAVWAKLRSSLG